MRVEELVGRPHLEDHKTAVVAAELLNKLVATFEDRLQLELAVLKGGSEKELKEHCNLDLVLDDALDLVFEDRWEVVLDFRGEAHTLQGGTPPHKSSSTGRVWTDQGEFFPSVFGLHWKEGNYAN